MSLQPSKQNIISPVSEGKEYIIVNLLSGNADFISQTEYELLISNSSGDYPLEFIQKGYVTDPSREAIDYQLRYIEFLEDRDKEELQLFFVPTYSCNFSCSYCYQSEYPNQALRLTHEITDSFFHFIAEQFGERRKYITLFGGEPLLSSPDYKNNIVYFLRKAKLLSIDVAIVTNGYYLDHYLEYLDASYVREVQVTLDGTREIHDLRRKLKNNKPTFDRIVENITQVLAKGISVNLRMVVDKENIDNLPALAEMAIKLGWTKSPLFKTQIGRNYELHYCQSGQSKLFDRLSLYVYLFELIKENPTILEFHKPAFSVMRFLQENGKLPNALFDACPACKSEWAMDFTGNIYSCTATVGKPGEKLGAFFPKIALNHEKIALWQSRDVAHIDECRDCNLQLACGGGCGSIGSNKGGSVLAPDCRPIDSLNALGAKLFFKNDFLFIDNHENN